MKWHTIELDKPETLPPLDDRVLALDRRGHIQDRVLICITGTSGWTGYYFSPNGAEPYKDITHWAEMPELPEKAKW